MTAFGAAALVGAVGTSLEADSVRHGAEAASLVALAACTTIAGRTAPPPLRRALLGFCLLLATSALIRLGADRISVPASDSLGPNGCPVESAATHDYWRAQLRYGQVAETLRFLALGCALQAVRMLPRSPRPFSRRRRISTGLLVGSLVLVVIYALFAASGSQGEFIAAIPGLLTLAAALALAALAMTRSTNSVLLVVGVVLTLLPAVSAAEFLADLQRRLPRPEPDNVFRMCLWATATATDTTPSVPSMNPAVGIAAVLLAGPALVVWAALPKPDQAASA
jgi:hypothetical protein